MKDINYNDQQETGLYEHIKRMNPGRLGKKIFIFKENRKTQVSLVKEVHRDLQKREIKKEDLQNRNVLSNTQQAVIFSLKVLK